MIVRFYAATLAGLVACIRRPIAASAFMAIVLHFGIPPTAWPQELYITLASQVGVGAISYGCALVA